MKMMQHKQSVHDLFSIGVNFPESAESSAAPRQFPHAMVINNFQLTPPQICTPKTGKKQEVLSVKEKGCSLACGRLVCPSRDLKPTRLELW